MDLGKELGNISKISLKSKIIIWSIIFTIIFTIILSGVFMLEHIVLILIFNFLGLLGGGEIGYLLPIVIILILILTPYLIHSILSAEYSGIIYEKGLEVTDSYSELTEIIYYTEIEEFYTIYNTLSVVTTILIKKKDGNGIIFSKRNGGSLGWEEKLVNAFSDAVYPSYNNKFVSGEKIPFSFYDKEVPHKSVDSFTKFLKTTKPNTLFLSKNGIEVNGSVFSKENIHNLSLDNTLISKNNIFLTLLKKLK